MVIIIRISNISLLSENTKPRGKTSNANPKSSDCGNKMCQVLSRRHRQLSYKNIVIMQSARI